MNLKGNELAALMYVAREVINVDGEVNRAEQEIFANVFSKFGLDNEELTLLIELSYKVEAEEAIQTLINLGPGQRTFASALVTLLVAADGKLTDDETELYAALLKTCHLPYLTIDEAIEVLK